LKAIQSKKSLRPAGRRDLGGTFPPPTGSQEVIRLEGHTKQKIPKAGRPQGFGRNVPPPTGSQEVIRLEGHTKQKIPKAGRPQGFGRNVPPPTGSQEVIRLEALFVKHYI